MIAKTQNFIVDLFSRRIIVRLLHYLQASRTANRKNIVRRSLVINVRNFIVRSADNRASTSEYRAKVVQHLCELEFVNDSCDCRKYVVITHSLWPVCENGRNVAKSLKIVAQSDTSLRSQCFVCMSFYVPVNSYGHVDTVGLLQ